MNRLNQLRLELADLERQASEIREKGYIKYPADFCLDTTTVKGKTYYRRRPRLTNGRPGKAEIISAELHSDLGKDLAQGRSLHRLEKQIAKVTHQIDAIALQARRLGLAMPAEDTPLPTR